MLYLVECRKKEREQKTYTSFFPEGIEAQNGKEAIRSVLHSLGCSTGSGEVMIDGETYYDFHVKPQKWSAYKTPMTTEARKEAFEQDLIEELEHRGFESEPCFGGIRVKTGVDTWIISVREAHDEDAMMILYHKNNWNGMNDKNCSIPGFHKQAGGVFTIDAIIKKMTTHERKWKSKKVS